jgi:pyridoxamine 5'-phosphate oxidase-like protein
MEIPRASRPYMPGYGIARPEEGSGLLHWSWAAERLTTARNYWVATVWPDGRPHIMPVWGMWDDSTLWFSSAEGSRKVRNLAADPRCCIRAGRPSGREPEGAGDGMSHKGVSGQHPRPA